MAKQKQDTKYKSAPSESHVRRFRRRKTIVDVQFKGNGTTYSYNLGSAIAAAGVLANLVRASSPGKVVWARLRRPAVPFKKN